MDKPHKQLHAWQESMNLAQLIYQLTASFPAEEKFGLTAQLRRAAVSIPSNIAEGAARSTTRDYVHFLVVARGLLSEMDTQLELAVRLGYLPPHHSGIPALNKTGKLLSALISSLRNKLKD